MNPEFETALNSFVKVDQEYVCPIVDETRLNKKPRKYFEAFVDKLSGPFKCSPKIYLTKIMF